GWYGTEINKCVEFPGPFERLDSPGFTCPSNGKIIGFHTFTTTESKYTWPLHGFPSYGAHDFFAFEVCNNSRERASVAIMGRADPGASFVVEGWYNVSAGSCQGLGRYARGTFYAMAFVYGSTTRGWWQEDIKVCVELPGPFNRAATDRYTWHGEEKLVPFRKFNVTDAKVTWPLN